MGTALALSGGGAKGCFEAGAIMYIAERWDEFDISSVAGTSAGAINALAVSHFRADSRTKLPELWLSLQGRSYMFRNSAQLNAIRNTLRDLGVDPDAALAGGGGGTDVNWNLARIASFVPFLGAYIVDESERHFELIAHLLRQIGDLNQLFSLDPVRSLLYETFYKTYSPERALPLRLVFVSMLDGRPYYVDEAGRVYRFDNLQPRGSQYGNVGLVVAADANSAVIEATLGSASIPVFFGTRRMLLSWTSAIRTASDLVAAYDAGRLDDILQGVEAHEVADGGLRDNLPIHAASLGGPDRIIAVSASPRTVDKNLKFWAGYGRRLESFGPGYGLLDAIIRSIDLLTNEGTETDRLEAVGDQEVVSVFPMYAVHDLITVDPGLIRLNLEYGYMRAFDAFNDPPVEFFTSWRSAIAWLLTVVVGTEDLVSTRHQIWALEHQLSFVDSGLGGTWAFHKDTIDTIRQLKWRVYWDAKKRVDAWGITGSVPRSLPNGAVVSDWWLSWERAAERASRAMFLEMGDPWSPKLVLERNGVVRRESVQEVGQKPPSAI